MYETEGTGGFPGVTFMARPVIGGTFAFLTLGRACGGKAIEGLSFLEKAKDNENEPAEHRNILEHGSRGVVEDGNKILHLKHADL